MDISRSFIGPTYNSRSSNFDAQRCVNLYPEIDPMGGKSPIALVGTPGFTLFANIGALPMRGMHTFNGLLYVVQGNHLYSVNNAGVLSSVLGTLSTSTGRVSMANNGLAPTGGNQLMIVDGVNGYIFNVNNSVFSTISGGGWPASGANTVTFIDGYFIINQAGSASFLTSNLYDGTTWNALNIASVNADSGNLIAVGDLSRDLWLHCENTTEVWYDSGSGFPPFQRYAGGVMDWGIAARWSATKLNNTRFWLAKNKTGQNMAVMAVGYNVQTISTPALEYQWSTYSTTSDAVGYGYMQEGHIFWVLNFPTGNATFVYDVTTKMWHERSTYSGSFFTTGRHAGDSYAFLNGMHLIGDFLDGDIYQLSTTAYTDNGAPIVSFRTGRHISEDLKNIIFDRFQVDMEEGTGDGLNDQGNNPQAMLQWSDDGGHIWSNEHWANIGQQGQYKQRVIWRRLGKSRDRIFRVTISDPVKRVFIGASVSVRPTRF